MAGVKGLALHSRAIVVGLTPAAALEALISASACVDSVDDVAESTMFPEEAAAIAHAVTERRREFATVRSCARRALCRLGIPPVAILPDADGVPQWPAGVVGSMTHCAGYRAAVVARSDRLGGIGIDAEVHAALPGSADELVLLGQERTAGSRAGGGPPGCPLGPHRLLRQGGGVQSLLSVDSEVAGLR